MAYILRNAQGNIIAVSAESNLDGDWQYIAEDSNEYLEYLENSLAKNSKFRESDIQLARVLEDLISMLIERNLIRFTDFPAAAQKRLIDRQSMRKKTQLSSILEDGPDSLI